MPKFNRFSSSVHKDISGKDLSIIILAAGLSNRAKHLGSKSLIVLKNHKTLIENQIDILSSAYPNSDIIVVVGFEAQKIVNKIGLGKVRFVENIDYENSGIAKSMYLGILASLNSNYLFIYGDIIFDSHIRGITPNYSCVLTDHYGYFGDNKIGLILNDHKVEHLSYAAKTKWAHISYINQKDKPYLVDILQNKKNHNLLGWEVLNELMKKRNIMEFDHSCQIKEL